MNCSLQKQNISVCFNTLSPEQECVLKGITSCMSPVTLVWRAVQWSGLVLPHSLFERTPHSIAQDALAACLFARYYLKPRRHARGLGLSSKTLQVGESCRKEPGRFIASEKYYILAYRTDREPRSCFLIRCTRVAGCVRAWTFLALCVYHSVGWLIVGKNEDRGFCAHIAMLTLLGSTVEIETTIVRVLIINACERTPARVWRMLR